MKIIIELRNGEIDCISSNEDCTIYIVNHDNKKGYINNGEHMRVKYAPNFITYENESDTPLLDEQLDDIISSGMPTTDYENSMYN